jgi:hypothetical protein
MPKKIVNPEAADDFDVPGTVSQVHSYHATPEPDATCASNLPEDSTEAGGQVNAPLSESLRESFELLKQVEAQPASTRADEEIKAVRLSRIKAHIFQLQQVPTVTLNSENMRRAFRHQNAKAKVEKLKVLAREHPEVAEIIAENKKLREKLKK